MQAIERVIEDIAPTDIPILLVGESGSGKDALALRIHRLSAWRDNAFVKLSCAGLRPGSQNGTGMVPSSGAGTLFLDEIGDLHPRLQHELMRSLANGKSGSLGPSLTSRLICSTSRDLEEEMRAGRLWEELYYRINGVCLRLPPLRHRREDIPSLTRHFFGKYSNGNSRQASVLRETTLKVLAEYAWPGNIRELEEAVRQIVASGNERAVLASLSIASEEAPDGTPPPKTLSLKVASRAASRQAERELILKALARTRWNRKRAAQELQISYKALLYKLKQIGIEESASF